MKRADWKKMEEMVDIALGNTQNPDIPVVLGAISSAAQSNLPKSRNPWKRHQYHAGHQPATRPKFEEKRLSNDTKDTSAQQTSKYTKRQKHTTGKFSRQSAQNNGKHLHQNSTGSHH